MTDAPDWELLPGDMREVLAAWGDREPVDAVVTDPPYELTSVVRRFGSPTAAPARSDGPTGVYRRASAGFMGKRWDGTGISQDAAAWRLVHDVMRPGAHLLAFGGTRTHHRMMCAIEDAGFEVRDCVMWLYGTGFPKSHDVSRGIDQKLGATREVVGTKVGLPGYSLRQNDTDAHGRWTYYGEFTDAAAECATTNPGSPEAAAWSGWGTALKPAWEPIILARRPLDGTVAECVLAHGCGGLNIDVSRVPTDDVIRATRNIAFGSSAGGVYRGVYGAADTPGVYQQQPGGRWPANAIHDGSDEVLAAFAARGDRGSDGDASSAARFFYCAKASAAERVGSRHPTVKPLALLRYLVRLVTRPGGLVLDPFAGTGTTLRAALDIGCRAVGIEREAEYIEDIRRRMGNTP